MEIVDIERILQSDLSEGTEWFRESLLQQCLSVLAQVGDNGIDLGDAEIDMLAAAGVYGDGERPQTDDLG